MQNDLPCPSCGDSDHLGTLETIDGFAHASFSRNPDGSIDTEHHGWTETDWDSSTTVGVGCKECGWSADDIDAAFP